MLGYECWVVNCMVNWCAPQFYEANIWAWIRVRWLTTQSHWRRSLVVAWSYLQVVVSLLVRWKCRYNGSVNYDRVTYWKWNNGSTGFHVILVLSSETQANSVLDQVTLNRFHVWASFCAFDLGRLGSQLRNKGGPPIECRLNEANHGPCWKHVIGWVMLLM